MCLRMCQGDLHPLLSRGLLPCACCLSHCASECAKRTFTPCSAYASCPVPVVFRTVPKNVPQTHLPCAQSRAPALCLLPLAMHFSECATDAFASCLRLGLLLFASCPVPQIGPLLLVLQGRFRLVGHWKGEAVCQELQKGFAEAEGLTGEN